MTDLATERPLIADSPRRALNVAIVVSGARCVLTYIVLPTITPALRSVATVSTLLLAVLHSLSLWLSARAARRCWKARRVRLVLLGIVMLLVNLIGLVGLAL
jgi:hypothetical protein